MEGHVPYTYVKRDNNTAVVRWREREKKEKMSHRKNDQTLYSYYNIINK